MLAIVASTQALKSTSTILEPLTCRKARAKRAKSRATLNSACGSGLLVCANESGASATEVMGDPVAEVSDIFRANASDTGWAGVWSGDPRSTFILDGYQRRLHHPLHL